MSTSLLVTIMLFSATALYGESYCSLSVRVQNPSGAGVETKVSVEESNGSKTEQETIGGIARFCGLGITPVSVSVGYPACDQVTVRNVPLEWNVTRDLTVSYDEAPCMKDSIPVAACSFLLRFKNVNDEPIGAVSFVASKPFSEDRVGDEFGRVFLRIAGDRELLGVASASGYKPAEIQIPCISKNKTLEELIVLKKPGQ